MVIQNVCRCLVVKSNPNDKRENKTRKSTSICSEKERDKLMDVALGFQFMFMILYTVVSHVKWYSLQSSESKRIKWLVSPISR